MNARKIPDATGPGRKLLAASAKPPALLFACAAFAIAAGSPAGAAAQGAASPVAELPPLPPNTWVKLSPREGAPPSPRLGYEGACAYDSRLGILVRYGGHNQGGGGEQNAEVWVFDPRSARWEFKLPNTSPPGVCCAQQNVFDPAAGLYVRFPAFSASHGWQWLREVYLNDSSVWVYDPVKNLWRNRRPLPEPRVHPLRCASWDSRHEVIVVAGGEGSREGTCVYDPYANTWTRMRPVLEPPPRSAGNLAYDRARGLHVLFGAQFDDDPHTWAYDLTANLWRDLAPPLQPPTDKNDAVLAYDEANAVIVALIKVTSGEEDDARHRLETWAYDAGENRWRKMDPAREPDPSGNRARVLAHAPDLGACILENRTHPPQGEHEQQVWLYRYPGAARNPEPLPPPATVAVEALPDGARVRWTAAAAAGDAVEGHAVYRAAASAPWEARFERVHRAGRGETEWVDRGLERGKVHLYRLRAVGAGGREGPESAIAQARARAVEDVVVSVLSAREVKIAWSAPHGAAPGEIAGYHVERAAVEVLSDDQLRRLKSRTPPLGLAAVGAVRRIGPFRRLTSAPVAQASYLDPVELEKPAPVEGEAIHERRFDEDDLDPAGRPYPFAVHAYRVRAVNVLGVESGPSPFVLTIPGSPEGVFSREDGEACRLRWSARPEEGLRGYRVYRLDGRYDKEPVSRLTPEPLAALEFRDLGAGSGSRRYHVVAVDALGQEGQPSAPVWHRREWAKFYEPFTGEWHQ